MTIHHVANASQLEAAFQAAKDGDRIELAAGNYGYTSLEGRNFSQGITITSADPANRAVFDTKLLLKQVSGVTVTGVDVARDTLSLNANDPIVTVGGSQNVMLQDMTIKGYLPTAADGVDPTLSSSGRLDPLIGYGYGMGVRVLNSDSVVLDNLDLSDLRLGIRLERSNNTTVSNVDIHDVREGMGLSDIDDTVIRDSYFHDFKPWNIDLNSSKGDHSDMIQFWGVNSSSGVHRLLIQDNLFHQPEGLMPTQTIFGHLNNAPANVTLTDFTITGNMIINGHTNAIRLSDVDNFIVSDNLLVPATSPALNTGEYPLIHFNNSTNGTVTDNVVMAFWNGSPVNLDSAQLAAANISVSNSFILSRSSSDPNYWGDFQSQMLQDADALVDSNWSFIDYANALLSGQAVDLSSGTGTGGTTSGTGGTTTGTGGTGGTTTGTGGTTSGTGGTTTGTGTTGSDDDDTTGTTGGGGTAGSGSTGSASLLALIDPDTTPLKVVMGTNGDDRLRGGSEDSLILGLDGDDKIYEGDYSDVMVGGNGADIFMFDFRDVNGGQTHDIIVDLDFAQGDTLRLINGEAFYGGSRAPNSLQLMRNDTIAVVNSLGDLANLQDSGDLVFGSTLSGDLVLYGATNAQQTLQLVGYTLDDLLGL